MRDREKEPPRRAGEGGRKKEERERYRATVRTRWVGLENKRVEGPVSERERKRASERKESERQRERTTTARRGGREKERRKREVPSDSAHAYLREALRPNTARRKGREGEREGWERERRRKKERERES